MLQGLRVLLVEDEAELRHLLSEFLADQGMEVFLASGLKEAFKVARQHSLDFFISDLHLIDGNGLDLLAQLSAQGLRPKISLLMSGDLELEGSEEQPAGVDALLFKPFRMGALLDKMKSLWSDL